MTVRPGDRNLITDVPGLRVGNAGDARVRTGVTVLLAEQPAVAAVDIRGGAPGTRGTAALGLDRLVDRVDAIVLSGGSEYGLDAPGAVLSRLSAMGRGFVYAGRRVPIVPGAVLFDLLNGGDKGWGDRPPYGALAGEALERAGADFALGNAGAGLGATAGRLKAGLGSASAIDPHSGHAIGALAAVNPHGSAVVPGTDCFWAAPFALDAELGDQPPFPAPLPDPADLGLATVEGTNTVLAIVATDAALSPPEAQRLAIMAQDGVARAIRPAHTPLDGDVVFAVSTGARPLSDPSPAALVRLGSLAADTLARAIARGVYEADDLGEMRCYRSVRAGA